MYSSWFVAIDTYPAVKKMYFPLLLLGMYLLLEGNAPGNHANSGLFR